MVVLVVVRHCVLLDHPFHVRPELTDRRPDFVGRAFSPNRKRVFDFFPDENVSVAAGFVASAAGTVPAKQLARVLKRRPDIVQNDTQQNGILKNKNNKDTSSC